jgi:hypothetical protein
MVSRRLALVTALLATAISFFTLGVVHSRRIEAGASYDAKLDAIRAQGRTELERKRPTDAGPRAPAARCRAHRGGRVAVAHDRRDQEGVAERDGAEPLTLLRDRRASFVELYSRQPRQDQLRHRGLSRRRLLHHGELASVALKEDDDRQSTRKITSIKIVYKGKEIPARLVDTGDADQEVHSGDWAIIKTRDLDLPPLHVDSAFGYDFAEPIFRLGNDYSKGIILSTGYVGQRTANGLVTCLTDGHPGVSGGGVLDQRGNLVGIPIGRMQGDYASRSSCRFAPRCCGSCRPSRRPNRSRPARCRRRTVAAAPRATPSESS